LWVKFLTGKQTAREMKLKERGRKLVFGEWDHSEVREKEN